MDLIPWSGEAAKLLVPGFFVGLGALIALLGTLVTGLRAASVVARNNRQNLFVNTVTAERAKWRQDLRCATAELRRAVEMALANSKAENLAALHTQRVQVRLRLNPSMKPKHKLDQQALAALRSLAGQVVAKDGAAARATFETLEAAIQALLKQEWEKSKDEARTGEMQTGEENALP